MSFMRITSPHAHTPGNSGDVMQQVILATIPGLIALSYFFGPGSLINVIMATGACVAVEAAILKLRQRPLGFYLGDYSGRRDRCVAGLSPAALLPLVDCRHRRSLGHRHCYASVRRHGL